MIKFELKYCKKCVTPNTRPSIDFDNSGVCSACNNHIAKKKTINWKKRLKDFKKILNKHKKSAKSKNYDCIVPVSGGKDSIYQTYVLKKIFKMNPLAITFRPLSRTYRGEENLLALKKIGVDHIDFTPNPKIINEITKKSFFNFGDTSYIDHLCIFNIIPNLAIRLNIPLVIWGENWYLEYGGKKYSNNNKLNNEILKKHHILKNTPAEKWISKKIKKEEISSFKTPNEKNLKKIKYEPIFLGYYLNWDIKTNRKIAVKNGFKPREDGPIMGLYNESDLDCTNIPIHHYFKWFKFGFNRVTDNCSNEIRKGRMTRAQAIKKIRKLDGIKPPKEFIEAFCKQININISTFWKVANKFRNKQVWKKNYKNKWYIKNWIGGDKIVDNFGYTKINKKEKLYLMNLSTKS
jgi:N-acetyl sugar amidotransferase|tara:strand:- start:4828 stop:6042 length:1215 start_codon:yes stop_codon:yes gene_type:complete